MMIGAFRDCPQKGVIVLGFHNQMESVMACFFKDESDEVRGVIGRVFEKTEGQLFAGDGKIFFKQLTDLYERGFDAVQKALVYKLNAPKLRIDCDVSLRTMVYFKVAFRIRGDLRKQPYEKHKYEIESGGLTYRGDTMTSFWGPFKNALFVYRDAYVRVCKAVGIHMNASLMSQLNHVLAHSDLFMGIFPEKVKRGLQRFAKNYHTIGNFLPIPLHFNVERSGRWGRWDSWDLTLGCIFNWYQCNQNLSVLEQTDDTSLKRLFKNKVLSIQYCKVWLHHFGTWDQFIEKNVLEDFVEELADGTYGAPIRFYPGHTLENPLPKTEEEVVQFLASVNESIELRSGKMHKRLKRVMAYVRHDN